MPGSPRTTTGHTPSPSAVTSTRSDAEIDSAAPAGGGEIPGGGAVVVTTGDGNGLADWASVVVAFAGLCVTIFVAWYGYRAYRSPRQDAPSITLSQ